MSWDPYTSVAHRLHGYQKSIALYDTTSICKSLSCLILQSPELAALPGFPPLISVLEIPGLIPVLEGRYRAEPVGPRTVLEIRARDSVQCSHSLTFSNNVVPSGGRLGIWNGRGTKAASRLDQMSCKLLPQIAGLTGHAILYMRLMGVYHSALLETSFVSLPLMLRQ